MQLDVFRLIVLLPTLPTAAWQQAMQSSRQYTANHPYNQKHH
jgi:hypothetical protein